MRKFVFCIATIVTALFFATQQSKAVPVGLDAGWVNGTTPDANTPLLFEFTLDPGVSAYFSLTDCCDPGDIWTITGTFSGVSTFEFFSFNEFQQGIGDFGLQYDSEWFGSAFSHFQLLLGPGAYALSIFGNGIDGEQFPASVGVRIDAPAVPLPAAFPLLAVGLSMLGFTGCWKRKAAV